MSTSALKQAVRDLDRHVSAGGWNQPTRLFAIAETSELLRREPGLATQLAGGPDDHPLTTVEQDGFAQREELDEMLGGITWPDSVIGAAVSTERVMVPPATTLLRSEHEVRVTMGVLRGGERRTTLRLRSHDSDDAVLEGEELITGLGDLLLHTLRDDL